MKYYVDTFLGMYKVKSFETGATERITKKEMSDLEKSCEIIYESEETWGNLLSIYSSNEVADADLDVHYIKNSVLNCQLDLSEKLGNKFGASVAYNSAVKSLTYLTYRISFNTNIDMTLVIEYLHEIGLVDFDFLVYANKTIKDHCYYYLRIKISTKYADAIVNDLARQRLKAADWEKRFDISEKYSGLVLTVSLNFSYPKHALYAERVNTIYLSMLEDNKKVKA